MSGKTNVIKHAFHTALASAMQGTRGSTWNVEPLGLNSWTVAAIRKAKQFVQTIRFTLRAPVHRIEITLLVVREDSPATEPPWWEDRRSYPTASGFRTVLWRGETYGHEQWYSVPKDTDDPAFLSAIHNAVKDAIPRANKWFVDAQKLLNSLPS